MAGDAIDLLDRGFELEAIRAGIGSAAQGRGGVVLIEAPGGMGKTRLLDAAQQLATEAGLNLLSGRGAVLEVDYAFGVARQLLSAELRARAETPVGGSLASLLEVESSVASDVSSFTVLESLCSVVLAAAERAPLLVCVDDAHWADLPTLRLLAYLAGRIGDARVLMTVATRPRERGESHDLLDVLATGAGVTVLRPAPLPAASIAEMVGREWNRPTSAAAPEFVAACATATGGNPFFVSELLRTASSERLEPTAADAARIAGFVPAGVSRAVLARIGRLPVHAGRVASALAVLGGRADWRALTALSDLPDSLVSESVDLLVGAEVLARCPVPEFRHPIIREAIYDDLPLSVRDDGHRRAARLLGEAVPIDVEIIAAHLMSARPRGDPWASKLLTAAAERALDSGAPHAAGRYLRRALTDAPDGEAMARVFTLLGQAERRSGNPEAAAAALSHALALSGDRAARAEVAQQLAQTLAAAGRASDAVSVLVTAIGALEEPERELGLRLEATLKVVADLDGDAGTSLRTRQPRFSAEGQAPASHGERLALAGRADEEMNRGTAEQAARLALRALDDGALLQSEGPDSVLFYSTAIVLLYSDHLDEAERVYTSAIAEAQRRKLRPGGARGFLAGVEHRRGSLQPAEHHARAALAPPPVDATKLTSMYACAFLIETLVDLGALDLAARTLVEVGAGGPLPDALIANVLQHARGRLRSAQGDHEGALADHLACGRRAAEADMRTPAVSNWHSAAALALAALGREQEARDRAAAGVGIATEFGSPRAIGIALLAEGQVCADADRLEQAAVVLGRTPARLEYARALITLGGAWRRRGERARARVPLREGMQLARACGAQTLAAQAAEELGAAGSRPRKTLRIGADTLTVSELRVGRLAADGRTNQEIADALVVSIRTVETHLAHIYQKLDIASRRQLPEALGTRPGGAMAGSETAQSGQVAAGLGQ